MDVEAHDRPQGHTLATDCKAKSSLRNIVMLYEDRAHWTSRAIQRGLSPRFAEQASHWLLAKNDIESIALQLSSIASNYGIAVTCIDLLTRTNYISELCAPPDSMIVWNITDGAGFFLGSHIPSAMTLMGVPYFGCPPFTQMIAQDKFKLYTICQAIGVAVPPSALVQDCETLSSLLSPDEKGPFFVKPNSLGNKVGLNKNSYCTTMKDAMMRSNSIFHQYLDRAIVQKFIPGLEVRATYINSDPLSPRARIGFGLIETTPENIDFVTFDKRDSKYRKFTDFQSWDGLPTNVVRIAVDSMTKSIISLSRHIGIKDYFTIDFRLDVNHIPHLIDFNSGAFLCGGEVEGYAENVLGLTLPEALLLALQNCHSGRQHPMFDANDSIFRL